MDVRIVTDVETEPVDLALVKDFCRIDADYTGEDATLSLLQASARELLETALNLSLAPKVIEVEFRGGRLDLPYGPHTAINSVKDLDDNLISEDDYRVYGLDFKTIDTSYTGHSFFYPIDNTCCPIIEPIGTSSGSGFIVNVNVGYTSLKLKSGLKLLILRLVDYMYQNRGSDISTLPPDIASDAAKYSRNLVL